MTEEITGPAYVEGHHVAWGYIIYRTVYTAESDALFPMFIDKFRTAVQAPLDKLLDDRSGRQNQYLLSIVQAKEKYNNATVARLRTIYQDPAHRTQWNMLRIR